MKASMIVTVLRAVKIRVSLVGKKRKGGISLIAEHSTWAVYNKSVRAAAEAVELIKYVGNSDDHDDDMELDLGLVYISGE